MEMQKKETYTEPTLVAHDLLLDITGTASGQVKTSDKASKEADGVNF